MCYIWQNPTSPGEEISLETIDKLPGDFDHLNLSGGEPTLRRDLGELVELVYPKAGVTEISSNGLRWRKLIPIVRRFPDIKIRFSLEGTDSINNRLRGERAGFQTKLEGLKALQRAGGSDLGFAIVVQDENAHDLVWLFHLAKSLGVELATSTLHNGWQFYRNNNDFYDEERVARQMANLVGEMLDTWDVKTWFRAYLNRGMLERVLGRDRLLPCSAGRDFAFIDPWADVWACNVRTDLKLGNLVQQSWQEVMSSRQAHECRAQAGSCAQNCWMVTTARTAMRSDLNPRLPKWEPLRWVLVNKIRHALGLDLNIDVTSSRDATAPRSHRQSFLDNRVRVKFEPGRNDVNSRYPLGQFENR